MVGDGLRGVVVLALALSLVAVTGAASTAPGMGSAQVDPDSVLLRVALQSDGSADWRVEYRVLLEDENTTEAFESLAADVEANRSAYVDRFADRMNRTVASAENATGREMTARNVTVDTDRTTPLGPDREYGVVVYSLRWTGFAVADGDRIAAGDAIAGLFLDERTRMIVSWPDGYRLEQATPDPEEIRADAVVWDGRLDFGTDEPRIVVTSSPATDPGPGDGNGEGLPVHLVALAAAVLLASIGAAGWLFVRRSGPGGVSIEGGEDTEDSEPPEELLSNEERVLRLLEDNDGRMKQQQVAEELDWTDAKTSQVVGGLRDEGTIEVFRLGRENVLSLPDEDDL